MKNDAERNEIRERLKRENKEYQGNGTFIEIGVVFFIIGLLSACLGAGSLVIIGLFLVAFGSFYQVYRSNIKLNEAVEEEIRHEKEQAEKLRKQAEQRQQQNQRGKDHSWLFPAEEFYNMCAKENATDLSNEYSFVKATNYAKQLIARENPLADMSAFNDYLEKEKLQSFLKLGKLKAQERVQMEKARNSVARSATPTPEEAAFLKRVREVRNLTGNQKRVKMLSDFLEDCDAEYQKALGEREAWTQLATAYGMQKQKEKDWSIRAGAAHGIAGPVAGAMTALEVMQENEKIREYNQGIQETANGYISKAANSLNEQTEATVMRNHLERCIEEAKSKVALSNPNADILLQSIKTGDDPFIVKNGSGVLNISMGIRLKRPVNSDVPDGVKMVIDGTIVADVLYDDRKIGEVIFLLPVFGMPCDEPATITLRGMCDHSVGCDNEDGEYSIQVQEKQNLWVMESASENSVRDVERFFQQYRPYETADQCNEKHLSNFDEEDYNRRKAFFNSSENTNVESMEDRINNYLREIGRPATLTDIGKAVGTETSAETRGFMSSGIDSGMIKKEIIKGRIMYSWNGD